MVRLRQSCLQIVMASERFYGTRNLAHPCVVASARVAARWISWEPNRSARDSVRRCVRDARRVLAVVDVPNPRSAAFGREVVTSVQGAIGGCRCNGLGEVLHLR